MPKLTLDNALPGLDPATLSKRANAHFEALAFMHEHPDFLASKQNSGFLMAEFRRKGIESPTLQDFEDAYEKGLKEKKFLTREEVRQVLQAGSTADVQKLAEREGYRRYDERGKDIGYDFPESFTEPLPKDKGRARQAGRATTDISPVASSHPNDATHQPSKREFAGWGPTRQREWLEASGHWGRDLPDYLK